MFASKISSLIIVTSLTTHGNGCFKIEFEIARRFDELFELVHILELGIAVQEESRMV